MQAEWITCNCPGNSEWQPPFLNANWRAVGGGQVLSIEPLFWVYMAALGGVLLMAARRWRTADLVPVAVMGFWTMMSLWHLRAVSDAVLLTSPLVAASLTSSECIRRSVWPRRLGIGLTVGLALLSLQDMLKYGDWQPDEARLSCLTAAIARHSLSGRVFTTSLNLSLFVGGQSDQST